MTRIGEKRVKAWMDEIDEASRLAGVDPKTAADDLVSELPVQVVRELAARCLAEKVIDRRRAQTLAVERSVERSGSSAETPSGQPMRERTPEDEAALARAQAEGDEEVNKRFWKSIGDLTTRYAAALKMEWTRELLDSGFALPDGTTVLWGDATVEQHQARYDMFMRNAQVNAEGAARHEQAIRDLTQAHASTLREMVSVRD